MPAFDLLVNTPGFMVLGSLALLILSICPPGCFMKKKYFLVLWRKPFLSETLQGNAVFCHSGNMLDVRALIFCLTMQQECSAQ